MRTLVLFLGSLALAAGALAQDAAPPRPEGLTAAPRAAGGVPAGREASGQVGVSDTTVARQSKPPVARPPANDSQGPALQCGPRVYDSGDAEVLNQGRTVGLGWSVYQPFTLAEDTEVCSIGLDGWYVSGSPRTFRAQIYPPDPFDPSRPDLSNPLGGADFALDPEAGLVHWVDIEVAPFCLLGGETYFLGARGEPDHWSAIYNAPNGQDSYSVFEDDFSNRFPSGPIALRMLGNPGCRAGCINWDDIATSGDFSTLVPGNYQGHCWSNQCTSGGTWAAELIQAIRDLYGSTLPTSSAPNVAFNGFGETDCTIEFAGAVAINSCRITRWPNVPDFDAETVRFVGTLGGNPVFDFTVPTVNEWWSAVDFGGVVIDKLVVTPPEGPNHWWLMDDLCLGPCDDVTPPEADITSPGDFGCGCDPTTIIGTANDPDGAFGSYTLEYRKTGDPNWTLITTSTTPVIGGVLADWNTGGLPEGWYLVRLIVRNACGLVSSDAIVLRVSKQFDDLELRSPADGAVVGGLVCFDGTAWENACFDYYTIEYRPAGGGAWNVVDPGHPTYNSTVLNDPLGSWDTLGLSIPDGDYDIRVQAFDDCGNMDEAAIVLTVDNTSPTAVISSPVNCDPISGIVQVIGTADDANLAGWTLQYTGGNANGWVTIASGSAPVINDVLANWDTGGLPPCAYTLRLIVTDSAVLNCNGAIHHRSEYTVSVSLGSGCAGDLDGDGDTDQSDLGILLGDWGCTSP